MKQPLLAAFLLLTLAPFTGRAAEAAPILRDQNNLSLRNQVQLAIDRGLAFLQKEQRPGGEWGEVEMVQTGLTSLAALAFQHEPSGKYRAQPTEFLQRAYEFIRSGARANGGIYRGNGAQVVSTALAMDVLLRAGGTRDAEIADRARKFLIGAQVKNAVNPAMNGGVSYGEEGAQASADLHNTFHALEALRMWKEASAAKETPPGSDLNWQAAIEFVTRCQNLPSHNKEAWASDDAANKGGFVYFPGDTGDEKTAGRAPARGSIRSYGSMSACGLLSLYYADVPKDDPRMVAGLKWLADNFSVDENPGKQRAGIFFYYHCVAKGLSLTKTPELMLPDGRTVAWARELARKIISTQDGGGFWVNENGEWMENDKVLATSYCLTALEILYHQL